MKKVIIILVVSILILVAALVAILTGVAGKEGYQINEEAEKTVEDTAIQMDGLAVQAFNMHVTPYINKNASVSHIKQLYSSVMIANQTRKVDILLNDKQFNQSDLKEESRYDVVAEYDKEGYINKVIVKEVDM